MYHFTENFTRGGVSYIVQIYSKAESKYMKSCNEDKTSKYVVYLAENNLYGSQ